MKEEEQKVIFIDIDETICSHPNTNPNQPRAYSQAIPDENNIQKANQLYEEGHRIVYWTARGSLTGQDWTEVTRDQLSKWGVKYHELRLGKPHYDLFIDDKALNTRDWK